MTRTEFDIWLERRAREKPGCPIYAHLVGRSRIDYTEKRTDNVQAVETPVLAPEKARSVANPVVQEQRAKDYKQEASDHDDDPFDGIEPQEEGNQ